MPWRTQAGESLVIVFDRKIWSDIVRWSTLISSTVQGGKVTSYLLSISIFKTLPLKRSKFFLLPQIYVQDSLKFTENQRLKKNILITIDFMQSSSINCENQTHLISFSVSCEPLSASLYSFLAWSATVF